MVLFIARSSAFGFRKCSAFMCRGLEYAEKRSAICVRAKNSARWRNQSESGHLQFPVLRVDNGQVFRGCEKLLDRNCWRALWGYEKNGRSVSGERNPLLVRPREEGTTLGR